MAVFHKQCLVCNEIMEGPAAGQNPGHHVDYISDTGEEMQETGDETHPLTVSHGLCDKPECVDTYERQWFPRLWEKHQQEREAARRQEEQQQREERRQQRRMRRGRKDKQ